MISQYVGSHVVSAISPDGTLVASGCGDQTICITNIATQEKVHTVKHALEGRVRALLLLFVLTVIKGPHSVACRVVARRDAPGRHG